MVTSAKNADPISDAILNAVRTRGVDPRFGIGLAADYLKSIAPCFDSTNGGLCPVDIFQLKSADAWTLALKEAESKLVFHDALMLVKEHSQTDLTEGSIMDFDGYLTTTQDDRDGDLLESKGATLDPMMPLLFNHIPMQPIGRLVKCLEQNSQYVFCKWALANTALGNDMAALVELKVLRMSHGFRPVAGEFEPRQAKSAGQPAGWHIKKFGVYEGSLVPIPSNVGAIVTAHSRKMLKSAFVDRWAKGFFDNRGAQGVGFDAAQLGTSPAPVGQKDASTSSAGGSISNASVMGKVGDAGNPGATAAKPTSMLLSATCPACGASFDMTTIPDGADLSKIICPMCSTGGGSARQDSSVGDHGQSNAGGGINQAAVTGATRTTAVELVRKEGRVLSAANHGKLTEAHGCIDNGMSILKQVMDAAQGNDLTSDMNNSTGDKSGAGAISGNFKSFAEQAKNLFASLVNGQLQTKYLGGAIEPNLRGSFEWISTKLETDAISYLRTKGFAFSSDTRAGILGTYATFAIVCVRDWSAETYPCFRLDWTVDAEGNASWTGDPKKVEIIATVVEKALAARSLSAAVQRLVADGLQMSTKAAKSVESELALVRDRAENGVSVISSERTELELSAMIAGSST